MSDASNNGKQQPLGIRAKAAAKMLGIGTRKLWELTNSKQVPHLRIGRAVVYRVEALNEWLAEKESAQSGGTRR